MLLLLALLTLQDPPIRVPEGWTVERAVRPGLVDRPIMAGFDPEGRLYVADSAGVNLRFDKLLENPPHRIVRLEDRDADGVFETSVVFADKLAFPMGLLWHRGELFVCSPPSLWRFRDADGDGKADERTELVGKFGSIGNAADVHGPFLGPEGRLWWTDGRHGHNIRRSDGTVMAGKAARIFRCRPDGRDVEVVCGGGMDNPVEIDFSEEGEPFVTCNLFLASPRRVDVIFHAIEGGVFPYHEVLNEFKRTGELLPSVVDLGWVAPSGLRRSRTDGAWYTAQFNTHQLQRHAIERDGAGFRGRNEEFLTSESPDFHPTDVVEDADGSLLLLDTGGWFRIGCPTSQVDKPNVLGGIWRLRRRDAPRVDDPRGLNLGDPKPGWLDDPRFAVRERAIDLLPDAPLDGPTPRARRNAVWARTRGGRPIRAALADPDASVRQSAARACGLELDREAAPALIRLLEDPALSVRREAATALGRFGTREATGALLEALPGADRSLDHALIFALLTIGDDDALRAALLRPEPAVRRGALIALDQRDALAREELTPGLDPSQPALMQSALWILSRRPAWSGEIAGLLRGWLAGPPREEIRGAVAAFARDPAVQDLVARALRSPETRADTRVLLLDCLAQAPLDRLPATWIAELRWSLDSADGAVVRQAVATIRATSTLEFPAALLAIARDPARDEELRVEAAAAARPASLDDPLLKLLLGAVAPAKPPLLRMAAARTLGGAAAPEALLTALASAGPMELPMLVSAFERSKNAAVGRKLLAALETSAAVESLPADALRRAVAGQPDDVRAAAAPLLKRLEGDVDAQRARLAELEPLLAGGDPARGRDVFQGRTAACASCHAVGPTGARVGPDLTKIGGIRAPKDLLESIVFPSLSFVRGYEPAAIRTKDGAVLDGVVVRESADALTLLQADRSERRVPRASIAELRQGRVSIMPQGLDRQLSAAELRDLVAYLVSLR